MLYVESENCSHLFRMPQVSNFIFKMYWEGFRCTRNLVSNTEETTHCYSKIKLHHQFCITKTILTTFLWEESYFVKLKLRNLHSSEANPLIIVYLIIVYIQNTKKRISYISKHDGIMWINVDVTIFTQVIKKLLLFFKDRSSDLTLSRKIWI